MNIQYSVHMSSANQRSDLNLELSAFLKNPSLEKTHFQEFKLD